MIKRRNLKVPDRLYNLILGIRVMKNLTLNNACNYLVDCALKDNELNDAYNIGEKVSLLYNPLIIKNATLLKNMSRNFLSGLDDWDK